MASRAIAMSEVPALAAHACHGPLVERESAIADDAVQAAGGIAGIPEVDHLGRHAMAAGGLEQSVDRRGAARLLGNEARLEVDDRARGVAVAPARRIVRQVVRQVRAHHDERFGAAPGSVEEQRHLLQGPHRPRRPARARKSPSTDCRKGRWTSSECSSACARSLTSTKGSLRNARETSPGRGARCRAESESARRQGMAAPGHVDAMRGAREHHAAHDAAQPRKARVDRPRDRAGIHVARVRRDDRLGRARASGGRAGFSEIGGDFGSQRRCVARIKGSCHGGRSNGGMHHPRGAEEDQA